MMRAASHLAWAFVLAGGSALAQSDAIERLRACSLLAPAERTECLETLSREITRPTAAPATTMLAPGPAASADHDWIISETTSPIDYSPVAVATASSNGGPDGTTMQLSVQCRGGRTDLVISGPELTRRGEEYAISYAIDDARPVPLASGSPASGMGIAVRGDVVRFLTSLPDRGHIIFRAGARQGATVEGRYALAGLRSVLERLAGPCKWPAVTSTGRTR
jgi:hypothetical protein